MKWAEKYGIPILLYCILIVNWNNYMLALAVVCGWILGYGEGRTDCRKSEAQIEADAQRILCDGITRLVQTHAVSIMPQINEMTRGENNERLH